MSIHDDAPDGSGTMVYGGHWHPAEPNAYKWGAGPEMRTSGHAFLFCCVCLAYCEAMDVVVGNFGEYHCIFCGSDEVCFPTNEDLEGDDE